MTEDQYFEAMESISDAFHEPPNLIKMDGSSQAEAVLRFLDRMAAEITLLANDIRNEA